MFKNIVGITQIAQIMLLIIMTLLRPCLITPPNALPIEDPRTAEDPINE